MRVRPARLAFVTGLVVLVVAATLLATRPGADVGDVPSRADPSPTAAPSSAARDPADASDGLPSPAAPPAIGRRDGSIARLTPVERPVPVRLTLPDLGVDVAVLTVGVDPSDGQMVLPDDPRTAGWYAFGPPPGHAGSAVIAAHVDSRRYGVGPFARLQDAAPGAEVQVTFDDGTVAAFTTVARRRYAKTQLPVDELFRRGGPPTLALVTCGGAFDPILRRYEDNVVVYAVPT